MTASRWLGYKLAVATILGGALPLVVQLAHAAHLSAGFLEPVPPWAWVGVGGLGFVWPERAARQQLEQRRELLRAALPTFLGTLYVGASAGLSLQACLRYVAAQQAGGPLGAAIQETLNGLDGRQYATLEQALRGLGAACATPELDRVIGRLAGNTAAGAGLTTALRELAAAQRADDRAALVAHGQRRAMAMLGAVALFLVPPLLVVFLYPVVVLVQSF
jgi:Flp pilus assembly protein TadB